MKKALGAIELKKVEALNPEDRSLPASVRKILKSPALTNFRQITDFAACLEPLVNALKARMAMRHIAEAMPHFADNLDLTGFRNVMANLHYSSRPVKMRLNKIDGRLMPCLFVPEKGKGAAKVVLERLENGNLKIFDGGIGEQLIVEERAEKTVRGTVFLFKPIEEDELAQQQQKSGWFSAVVERFRPLVYQILAMTFLLNVLALATPLFVMAVYDKVVATGSMSTLAYFGIGVTIALGCDLVLRAIRSRILAYVGARMDNIIGTAVFQRILFLPPAFTERATIGSQVARIKDFESVRDFFTGPMAVIMFEMPFVVIFIITVAVLGGPVAFVPIIMLLAYAFAGWVFQPLIKAAIAESARYGSRRQEFTVEALSNMRAVKYTGAERMWLERYRELSANASMANFRNSQIMAIVNAVAHVLMVMSGVATIAFGVFRVFDGLMSVGGLVASMILVWRVLAPLQTGFVAMTRFEQIRSSIRQIDTLMNIRPERDPSAIYTPMRKVIGRVTFARVSLRYSADSDPALVGVNFDASPGEVVALVGGNGSGKSTVLKLVLGMYAPQAGSVRIDNRDIRQVDPVELRHSIGYVPQKPEFFYGTIAQNMRLANPSATEKDMLTAFELAGVLDDVMALPEKYNTRIGDTSAGKLPTSFLQRLNLARVYIKEAKIMLFDEPGNGLDFEADKKFMETIQNLKQKGITSFLVTHRPSYIKIADKIVWLDKGHLRMVGPVEQVKQHLPKDFL